MSGPLYYLGVDGGGTKTEFLCIDATGAIVARHRGPTAYHLQVGVDGAAAAIGAGVTAICQTLAITPADIAFAFFGLPAYGEDSVIDPALERACGAALGHQRYHCGNDMVCGWAGSLDCADGLNLVAGTGSIGYGERQGKSARVGGWGEVFSDEGSAYWIAVQGLNAFTRMSDGRLPGGPLHAGFVAALSLRSDLDICARIMGPNGLPRDAIAALAPVVAQAAADGDRVAIAIHQRAADELAAMADALRNTLGFAPGEEALISWSGGVLTNVAAVRDALEERLAARGGYRMVAPRHSPAYGAARYAARLAGPAPPSG